MGWVPAYDKEESVVEVNLGSGSISLLHQPDPPKKKHPIGFAPQKSKKKRKKP